MKQTFLSTLLLLLPLAMSADAVEINGIYYNLMSDFKRAEVTENPNKYSGSVILPKTVSYGGVIYDVTSIGDLAFEYCTNLSTIAIPNSITSIGRYSFAGCSSLTSLTIPSSVTYIHEYAFPGCYSLGSIIVEEGNPIFDSRGDCNAIIQTARNELRVGCRTTIIPQDVISIGNNAFNSCIFLFTITIPNSVEAIGENAFYDCKNLESVTFGDGLVLIGNQAFYGCSKLTSLSIPEEVTSIGDYAFGNCNNLVSFTFPNSLTKLGYYPFHGTAWFDNQPNGLVYAGKFAYEYKGDMPENTTINIKDGTYGICSSAFTSCDCSGLTNLIIPNSVTYIGAEAFMNTTWFDNQPDGLVYAGKFAYQYKGEMPENTEIDIKEGTIGIVGGAFQFCPNLTSVNIPNSVKYIGCAAFDGCDKMTTLTIPNSITSIEDLAFDNCHALKSITIPESVISIGMCAFSGCTSLSSATIGNGVRTIGDYAFSDCTSLSSVTIGNSVRTIGFQAFGRCYNLTSLIIPNNVISIGELAFGDCRNLVSVTIGSNVTSIGQYAFYDDEKIVDFYCYPEKAPEANINAFISQESSSPIGAAKLHVPAGSINAYMTVEPWREFKKIIAIGGGGGEVFGDVNGDGAVNAVDIIAIMNYISGYAGSIALEKADVNGDRVVNIGDIIVVSNMITGNQ